MSADYKLLRGCWFPEDTLHYSVYAPTGATLPALQTERAVRLRSRSAFSIHVVVGRRSIIVGSF